MNRYQAMKGQSAGTRIEPGAVIASGVLMTIQGKPVPLPDPRAWVHLQFRRFAGCPICDLHLSSFARRHPEIEAAGIREVAIFHSSVGTLLPFAAELPFAVVADPEKRLYARFGIEAGRRSLVDPRAWGAILRGVYRSARLILQGARPAPSLNPHGGRFGLPADFLIGPDGVLAARKYGVHAYDQWSVDDLLELAAAQLTTSRSARSDMPGPSHLSYP